MNSAELDKLDPLDHRILDWKPFPVDRRDCPFCGEYSAPLFLRPDNLPFSQCNKCKCFYVSLRVSNEALNAFYDRYWTDTCPRPLTDEMARYLTASAPSRAAADHCLQKLGALSGTWKDRKVLDVGCGFGEKATMMKALGASVTGLDISADAVNFVTGQLGIETYGSTVEQWAYKDSFFDIVTMFEFIEHPLEPRDAIRAAFEKLKAGGLLAIVTPNGTAGERFINDKDGWPGFRAELEHMQYLHVETISYIVSEFGFSILHLEQLGFRSAHADPAQIDTLSPSWMRLRRLIKGLPGVRQAVYTLRHYQAKHKSISMPPDEAGNYHIFAVLQKR